MATRPRARRPAGTAPAPQAGDQSPARDRILYLLKTRGPLAASSLASHLGVSAVAVRQHLAALGAEGLVAPGPSSGGSPGRPARAWALTPAAMRRFPDTHGDLTVEILRAARTAFGDEGLGRLVAERGRQQRASCLARVEAAAAAAGPGDNQAVEARLEALAAVRRDEGYMAEWSRVAEGQWLFLENHCPICAAATACQGFCRDELSLFREVLGPAATVERTEHIPAGARRCAYRVTTAPGASSGKEEGA